ncbi:DUF4214 domain-containing protein [Salipiger sp. P9]|uniref:DUF4214 domain-containing protein n=1 Tax=Salipiger pentaromativorans TaxID=2943193 RepID=UPI0021584CF3|nr:DUF4214 domain-containing protein [Salipiger pentaromativorans]MCR8550897.1 DUF4214 domain-containing protein [Salipiger pentaromativorans]
MNDLFGDFEVEYAALSTAYEPNDTYDTAADLTDGSHTVTGTVVDWFRIETVSGEIAIDLTALTSSGGQIQNLNMALYSDPTGPALAADIQPGGVTESIRYLAGTDGVYYLKVYWAQYADGSHPDGLSFGYQLDVDLPEIMPSDGNDTMETAALIGDGSATYHGTSVDWFRIDTVSGPMNFTMTPLEQSDGSFQNLNFTLYDANGNVLRGGNISDGGAETISHTAGTDGTYYLRVFWARYPDGAPNGVTLDYTLDVDLPEVVVSDGNDTMETAETITEGVLTRSGTGIDWYSFTAVSGVVQATLTATSGQNLNLTLFDSDGNVLRAGSGDTITENLSQVLATDGIYYLRVISAVYPNGAPNGVTLDYTLSLDLPEVVVSDGNDTMETAETITEGVLTRSGTGIDWYRFNSVSGVVQATLTATSGQNLNLTLFDSDGNVLRAGSGNAITESLSQVLATDGIYYLRVISAVYPNGAPNGVTLDYTLSLDLPEEVPSDGNDTQATAELLAAGVTTHSGTGIDWYRFNSVSGVVQATLTATSGQNLNLTLFDADGNVLRAGSGDAITENLSQILGTDGTYYLRVVSAVYPDGAPNGITLDYTLDLQLPVADPSDGNDTQATATPITEGAVIRSGTKVDWYSFETGPGMMNFALIALPFGDGTVPNLNLTLYNEAGTAIRANLSDGTESFSYMALEQTTYYLQVNWATYPDGAPNGFTMEYDLRVNLPDNTWSVPLEFGPVRNASVTVYDIDNDGKDEIFVGTSKSIDAAGNEVLPAGLIVLEDDGSIKWTQTFAAAPGVDPLTGKRYQTTSVSTAAVFSDLDNDGSIDIIVGVGADSGQDEFGAVGQPGDMGGVYALNADGSIKWFFQTRDSFGDDNRSDGVYGTPRVYDIDGDGAREVIFTSWDHYLYVLDGRTGELEYEVNVHDTAGATPAVGDIDGDGVVDLVVPSDISVNERAGIYTQGGLLQVLSNYGLANIEGWTDQIGDTTSIDFRGKFEEQSLWSSPQLVDLDGDGTLEIVQGTGNFFQDGRGEYIKVWNSDGSLRFERATNGRVMAAPLVVDLDGDGRSEIIAATTNGYVHAWTAGGTRIFSTQVMPYGAETTAEERPIVHQPIAVDMDNDGDLEILVTVGSQMIALDGDGTQISALTEADRVFNTYAGSPVAKDIDGDGRLDLISGGTTFERDQAMVFRFENQFDVTSDDYRTGAYQGAQSLHDIRAFVERFYEIILGRDADPSGSNNWTDRLYTGVRSGADVARGFIFSPEFVNQGTTNEEYVETLYAAFFGRPADATGLANWSARLDGGMTRAQVLNGFIFSAEFGRLAQSYGILVDSSSGAYSDAPVIVGDGTDANTLRGGPGDNIIYDEGTGVEEVYNNDKLVTGQVYRLYGATLAREPDANGFESWVAGLQTNLTLLQVATRFVNSAEFQNTYGSLTDEEFVTLLYHNVLGRAPDANGLANWVQRLEDGMTRAQVVTGFSESGEYRNNTAPELDDYMRTIRLSWIDVIEGGAGDDIMNGNTGGDIFIFRAGEGGNDVIHGFEPWDQLQLSGFGFESDSDAMAHMVQSGGSVVFSHAGQTITFLNTTLAEMQRVRYNLS